MKQWHGFILMLLINLALMCGSYEIGKRDGVRDGLQQGRFANECYCGTSQSCVFGPGILGTQGCVTRLNRNTWSRCEPVTIR